MRPRALALLLLCVSAASARGSTADVFGLGSSESAVAGASTARVHDFSAGYYNPAGLTLVLAPEVTVGVIGFGSQLHYGRPGDQHLAPIANPFGILVGAATPIPFTGVLAKRLYLGIALHILPEAVLRVIAHRPEDPFFPLYDNRTQRLLVLPTLAARIGRGVSVGIAFNYLAGLGGRVSSIAGSTRAVEGRVDESIFAHLGVNAGIRWQIRPFAALGLTYRQEFSVPFRTTANNQVAGEPIDLAIDAEGLYTPHQLVLGTAVSLPHRVLASLDVGWSHWSGYHGPYVTVSSQLPLVGAIDATPPHVAFNDTAQLRAGVEWIALDHRRAQLLLRGGFGFENAAASGDQPGVTNLLDGNKYRIALGGGLRAPVFSGHVRFDVHGQFDVLQPTTLVKKVAPAGSNPDPARALSDEVADNPAQPQTLGNQITNPGYPSLSGSGFVWAVGCTLTVEAR